MARAVQARSFAVGLHSAGIYPQRLAQLLPWLDWLALDIKTDQAGYDALTGRRASALADASVLEMALEAGCALECRTTWTHSGSAKRGCWRWRKRWRRAACATTPMQDERSAPGQPAQGALSEGGAGATGLCFASFSYQAQLSAANTSRLVPVPTTRTDRCVGCCQRRSAQRRPSVHRAPPAPGQSPARPGCARRAGHRAQLVQLGGSPLARRSGGLITAAGVFAARRAASRLGNRPRPDARPYTPPRWRRGGVRPRASSLASSRRWPVTKVQPWAWSRW